MVKMLRTAKAFNQSTQNGPPFFPTDSFSGVVRAATRLKPGENRNQTAHASEPLPLARNTQAKLLEKY
jgi:hypothetical protein